MTNLTITGYLPKHQRIVQSPVTLSGRGVHHIRGAAYLLTRAAYEGLRAKGYTFEQSHTFGDQ